MLCYSAPKAAVKGSISGSLPTSVVASKEREVALVELNIAETEQRYHAVMEVLARLGILRLESESSL
jgi:hypothetical protein